MKKRRTNIYIDQELWTKAQRYCFMKSIEKGERYSFSNFVENLVNKEIKKGQVKHGVN